MCFQIKYSAMSSRTIFFLSDKSSNWYQCLRYLRDCLVDRWIRVNSLSSTQLDCKTFWCFRNRTREILSAQLLSCRIYWKESRLSWGSRLERIAKNPSWCKQHMPWKTINSFGMTYTNYRVSSKPGPNTILCPFSAAITPRGTDFFTRKF